MGNGWTQTYTGRKFVVRNAFQEIDLDVFCERDIAHALGMTCRYAGHCLRHFSIAEHSVHIFRHCKTPEGRRAALFHDASEYILQDIIRPVKPELPGYYELEDRVCKAIAKRFDVVYPWPEEVAMLDNRILLDERAQNMAKFQPKGQWDDKAELEPAGYDYCEEEADGWPFHLDPLHCQLEFWDQQRAAQEWMLAYWNC